MLRAGKGILVGELQNEDMGSSCLKDDAALLRRQAFRVLQREGSFGHV
jgi:hypothetical protein